MSQRITYIPNRVIDANGISDGATIDVFATGTTTPVTIYSDAALATPITNPVTVAAGAAVPPIYHNETSVPRVRVTQSDGTVISDDDPFGIASETLTYTPNGTGAVSRTAAQVFAERISVKDYGAKGDGATDDTAAIVRAITYAATLAGNHPVAVYFPAGDYLYTSITITSSRVWLTGSARLIKTTTTGDGIVFDGTAGDLVQPGISGLTFGAQTANTSGNCVKFFKCLQASFSATIKPFPAAVYNGVLVSECTATKIPPLVQIENCVNDGIVFSDCVDVYWELGRSDANGRHGIVADNVSGFYPSAVTAFNNGENAWRFQKTFTPNRADANGFVFAASCIGDTSGGDNWYFDQLSNSVFSGCWGSSQSGTAADKNGFYLTGCFELEFNGCIALTNNACGFRAGGTASENIFINGGRYNDNGQESASTLRAGVSLGTTDQVVMDGVRMSDRQSTKTQQYGLHCDATLVQLSVDNCDMRGNAAGPYLFAAQPTLFQHSLNRTGETASYASANSVATSPFIDTFTITGTTDVLDFTPKYAGREVTCMMASTARFVGTAGGGALKMEGANATPGADGTACFVYNGSNWLLKSLSINDET